MNLEDMVWDCGEVAPRIAGYMYITGTFMYDCGSYFQLKEMDRGEHTRAWMCVSPKEVPDEFKLAILLLEE